MAGAAQSARNRHDADVPDAERACTASGASRRAGGNCGGDAADARAQWDTERELPSWLRPAARLEVFAARCIRADAGCNLDGLAGSCEHCRSWTLGRSECTAGNLHTREHNSRARAQFGVEARAHHTIARRQPAAPGRPRPMQVQTHRAVHFDACGGSDGGTAWRQPGTARALAGYRSSRCSGCMRSRRSRQFLSRLGVMCPAAWQQAPGSAPASLSLSSAQCGACCRLSATSGSRAARERSCSVQ